VDVGTVAFHFAGETHLHIVAVVVSVGHVFLLKTVDLLLGALVSTGAARWPLVEGAGLAGR
jgi:hypothetical protein